MTNTTAAAAPAARKTTDATAAAGSTASRTPAPAAPKAPTAKAPKAPAAKSTKASPCKCGCAEQTIRPEAMYRPGHDARHAGAVGKAILAGGDAKALLATLPTERLREKAQGMVQASADRKARRAQSGDAMREARKAAKAAYDKALAEALAPKA